jgi:heme A synthase
MLNILPYIAIASAMIGMVFLSLFYYSIVGGKKGKILKNLVMALIFIGIFGAYVVAAIKFKLPFF